MLSASSGKTGETITVQGKGWHPSGTVALAATGPKEYDIASVPVTESGGWESGLTVAQAPSGDYDLVFSENHDGCELRVRQTFTVPELPLEPDFEPPPVKDPSAMLQAGGVDEQMISDIKTAISCGATITGVLPQGKVISRVLSVATVQDIADFSAIMGQFSPDRSVRIAAEIIEVTKCSEVVAITVEITAQQLINGSGK
jgi:hypothetical protein